ncbi:hypothetical protein SAMN05192574_101376 [Mucilaginibacter gossypiicola]|uniref:Uncharacterized protein n=1 Tax=Mucilaginibacter gossypiicola TaxID=551995 RepID=A0A1H8A6C5_9SPHI|nr:hypothetical protein [Mucilaginibacter gossypiicola]SEM66113.1 hypothetical protein SAMN05192574_101376 [Mucilaginibacter gossypiicola]
MKKENIKTLEDAQAYITQVEGERDAALSAQKQAEEIANDAIEKASVAIGAAPKDFTTVVKNIGKVEVHFGADGVSKDELLDNHEKITELLKKGSHAVTLLEANKKGK